jgi:RNA polymerase sigma-70 factor (ECF subfamily)
MRAEASDSEAQAHGAVFATTHWSVVLAAGERNTPQSAAALEALCRTYWFPIYQYIRRWGYGPEDAQDLTQEFFVRLLRQNSIGRADRERGRFRSFLLGALKHLLADEKAKVEAKKRGGGQSLLSWEQVGAEDRLRAEPMDQLSPDRVFDRRWAMTVLEQATQRLRAEYDAPDRKPVFEELKSHVTGDDAAPSYARAAARLGLSESAVKSAIYRLRQRYHALVREEVAQTVTNPQDLEDEIRYLMSLFGAPDATG